MDYYARPSDEIILDCIISREDYLDLKNFLERESAVEKFAERGIANDSVYEPTVNHVAIQSWHVVVHVAKSAMPAAKHLGKNAVTILIATLVNNWVQKRNARKQKEIDAGEDRPLILDQYGQTIKVKKKP